MPQGVKLPTYLKKIVALGGRGGWHLNWRLARWENGSTGREDGVGLALQESCWHSHCWETSLAVSAVAGSCCKLTALGISLAKDLCRHLHLTLHGSRSLRPRFGQVTPQWITWIWCQSMVPMVVSDDRLPRPPEDRQLHRLAKANPSHQLSEMTGKAGSGLRSLSGPSDARSRCFKGGVTQVLRKDLNPFLPCKEITPRTVTETAQPGRGSCACSLPLDATLQEHGICNEAPQSPNAPLKCKAVFWDLARTWRLKNRPLQGLRKPERLQYTKCFTLHSSWDPRDVFKKSCLPLKAKGQEVEQNPAAVQLQVAQSFTLEVAGKVARVSLNSLSTLWVALGRLQAALASHKRLQKVSRGKPTDLTGAAPPSQMTYSSGLGIERSNRTALSWKKETSVDKGNQHLRIAVLASASMLEVAVPRDNSKSPPTDACVQLGLGLRIQLIG